MTFTSRKKQTIARMECKLGVPDIGYFRKQLHVNLIDVDYRSTANFELRLLHLIDAVNVVGMNHNPLLRSVVKAIDRVIGVAMENARRSAAANPKVDLLKRIAQGAAAHTRQNVDFVVHGVGKFGDRVHVVRVIAGYEMFERVASDADVAARRVPVDFCFRFEADFDVAVAACDVVVGPFCECRRVGCCRAKDERRARANVVVPERFGVYGRRRFVDRNVRFAVSAERLQVSG